MSRRRHLTIGLLAFALVAAACGGDDEPSPSAPTTPTTPPTAPVSTTDAPVPTTPPATSAPPGQVVTGELVRADVPYATTTAVTQDQLDRLVAGNTDLALDLLRAITADGGNTILSPFSIAAALTMTYAGARGVTAEQMREVLHLTLPDDEVHEARNEVSLRVSDVPEPREGDERAPLRVNIANSLWGQRGFGFRTEFLKTLASAYDAGVRLVDYIADPDGSRMAINDWVEDETEERIKDLLPQGSITTDTRLVLTNAIWFKANWAAPFDPDRTEPGVFHVLDGSEVTVPIMHESGRMLYTSGEGYAAVRLPYAGDASMLVIAPDSGRFGDVLDALDGALLAEIDESLSTHLVQFAMPKYEFESELSLKQVLGDLGMTEAFAPGVADFSGIPTEPIDMFLQDVVHKAFISVDEQGTEAAAATASIIGITSAPPPAELTLDRPFIYLIRHDSTGEILFAGTVTEPS